MLNRIPLAAHFVALLAIGCFSYPLLVWLRYDVGVPVPLMMFGYLLVLCFYAWHVAQRITGRR